MKIQTYRFGTLEVPEDKIISMERPILGFERLREFCLVEMDELAPFMWLQAIDDPKVAFMVLNPVILFPDYRININSMEIAELQVSDLSKVETYVVVTFSDKPEEVSANLQGPILINTANNKAKQLVLVNSEYRVKHSLLEAVGTGAPATVVESEPELVGA
jgi:flagellar assembly factor FliW